MAAVIICSDFGAPQNKVCHCLHGFPIYLPWSDGTRYHYLSLFECWVSFFTFIKRLFSSSSIYAINAVSSSYLRLLIVLLAILISACLPCSLVFNMTYSEYKLNKCINNIQPWWTPFPIWNQSIVPCPVPTVVSWPAYRFLRRQVRWSGIPISWRIFQFVVIYKVKGFGLINKADVYLLLFLWSNGCWLFYLWFLCFF